MTYNPMNPLTRDQLRSVAPSVFADSPWEKCSDKYAFIPTIQVVDLLEGEGYQVVKASQSRTRVEGKEGFTKHMLRFRHQDIMTRPVESRVGDLFPEIVVTNSHDTGSAFKVDLGIFRLACLNGMMVADSTLPSTSIRHSGRIDDVVNASLKAIEAAPLALEGVQTMNSVQLTDREQLAFATAARELRWPTDETGRNRMEPSQLLRGRRYTDRGPSLWATMNRVQENMVKGGRWVKVLPVDPSRPVYESRAATAVKGVDQDRKLNKALWALAEQMRLIHGNA